METTRYAFTSGIISPDMAGRVEVDHYGRSCETLDNYILHETGAIQRRPGSRHLATLPDMPLAFGCIRWTTGIHSLLLIYQDKLEVRYTDGTLWYSADYPADEGTIRHHQINDLVLILNDHTTPYTLRNNAGTLTLQPITYTHIPLEGNYDRDYPIYLDGNGKGVITDKWDTITYPPTTTKTQNSTPAPRAAQVPVNVVTNGLDFMSAFRTPTGILLTPWQTSKNPSGLSDGACKPDIMASKNNYATPGWDKNENLYYWYITSNTPDELTPNFPELPIKHNKTHLHYPWITIPAGKHWKFEAQGNWRGHLILQKGPENAQKEPIGELRTTGTLEGYTDTPLTLRLILNTYTSRTGWAGPTQLTHYNLVTPPDPEPDPEPGEPTDPPANPYTPITSATYKNTTYANGDTIAIRTTLIEKNYQTTAAALVGADTVTNPNLRLYNYQQGTKLRTTDNQGNYHYWTAKKFWPATPAATTENNLSHYPSSFEPGLPFAETLVPGAYEYTSANKNTYNLWAIQTTRDGTTWQTIHTQEDTLHPDQDYKYTGDNNGDPVKMRCALLQHKTTLDLTTIKKTFRRATARHTTYITITQLYSGGTFDYTHADPANIDTPLSTTWEWDLPAFRPANGYPAAACLHAGRLVFSGTRKQPCTLWFSCLDDLYNYRTGTATDQAMTLTYTTPLQSNLCWLASTGPALLLGTTTTELSIRSAKADLLSSSTAVAQQHTNSGSTPTSQALLTTDALMYIDRSGTRLRRITYSLETENYTARDMTVYAGSLLTGGIRSMAWQRAPQPIAWIIPAQGTNAGKLCGMLYNPDQNLAAWHTWTLGDIHHIATTPTGDPTDPLYLILKHPNTSAPGTSQYTLETIDYQPRDTDGTGGPWERPYTSTLLTTQLDTPDAVSKHRQCPRLEYLLTDCDLTDAQLTTDGQHYDPSPLTGTHTGWTTLLTTTAGTKTLKAGITLHHGHGKILSIRALGDQKN